jgi:hypothetical protein
MSFRVSRIRWKVNAPCIRHSLKIAHKYIFLVHQYKSINDYLIGDTNRVDAFAVPEDPAEIIRLWPAFLENISAKNNHH